MNKIKILAIAHILTALGVIVFWIGFFTEIIFPVEYMKTKIPNFAGYYAWESSFVVPDSLMALAMIIGGVLLLKNQESQRARQILTAASGALIFLGVLDFTFDFRNGMYGLGHFFSYILLEIGLFLPVFGIVSVWMLGKET